MLNPTPVWDAYWNFAHNRHEMWWNRLSGGEPPWTNDPILTEHRFTNSYRILDRVSQYLVSKVQYGETRSQAVDEVFFRTLLFKIFNRIDTWEMIEYYLGVVSWQSFDDKALISLFDETMAMGAKLYSAAYIIPSPLYGFPKKHTNHVELITQMVMKGLPSQIARSSSFEEVYQLFLEWPSLGPFLAFQYAIDINYSTICDHDESTFVIAGPGAHDGLSKCFSNFNRLDANQMIMETFHRQHEEFDRRGLPFKGLFGRPLQPIDLQNCYCETSKYTRKSHPEIVGMAGRSRIKQIYTVGDRPLPPVFLPPKWNLVIPEMYYTANLVEDKDESRN